MKNEEQSTKLAPLPHGVWHGAVVLGIQHAAEKFKKAGHSEWTYCHFFTFLVQDPKNETQGRTIKAQVCNEHQRFTWFDIDDIIRYTTNKYVPKFDRYTIVSYEVIKAKGAASGVEIEFDPTQIQYSPDFDGMEQGYPEVFDRKSSDNIEVEVPRKDVKVNGAIMLPENTVSWKHYDPKQLMATAQHNAALFLQMRGNVEDDKFLALSQKLFDQLKKAE